MKSFTFCFQSVLRQNQYSNKRMKKICFTFLCFLCFNLGHSQNPILVPQIRHFAAIKSIAMHPTSSFVFSADEKGNIKQWEVASKMLVRDVPNGLESIDFVQVVGGVGAYHLFAYSKQKKSIEIINFDSNKTVKTLSFDEDLLYLGDNYYNAAKVYEKSGHIVQIIGSKYRYWLDYKTFKVLKKIKLNFQVPNSCQSTFSKFAETMFYLDQGALKKRSFTDYGDFAGYVNLRIPNTDTITNIHYADGGFSKSYLLIATKESFFIHDIKSGVNSKINREFLRSKAPILKERSINTGDKYYRLKHNQLGYSKKKKLFVLGEALVSLNDLNTVLERYSGFSEMHQIQMAYTNYSNQNILIGYHGANLIYDFTDEPLNSALSVSRVFGAPLQITKSLISIHGSSLLLVDRHLKKYDLDKAQLEKEWFDVLPNVGKIEVSDDRKWAVVLHNGLKRGASIYDLENEQRIGAIESSKFQNFMDVEIMGSGETIFLSGEETKGVAQTYFVKSLSTQHTDKVKTKKMDAKVISMSLNSEENLLAVATEHALYVLEANSLKQVKEYKTPGILGVIFKGADEMVMYTSKEWYEFFYKKGPSIKKVHPIGLSQKIDKMSFKDGALLMFYQGETYGVKIMKGDQVQIIENRKACYNDVLIDPTNKRIIVALGNGEVQFLNQNSLKVQVQLLAKDAVSDIPMPNYLFYTDQAYFGSRNAFEIARFQVGKELFPLSHFDVNYNKPTTVIEQLNGKDESFKELLLSVQSKREDRVEFGKSTLNFEERPLIYSLDDETIDFTAKDSATFFVHASGGGGQIVELQAYVNGVPILEVDSHILKKYCERVPRFSDAGTTEMSGILDMAAMFSSFSNRDTNQFKNNLNHLRFKWPVALSYGENYIEFFCLNTLGIRSKVLDFNVTRQNPDKVKPNLYILALSVSDYKDDAYDLKYARKDGRDILAHFKHNSQLKSEEGSPLVESMYQNIYIDSFFDEQATKNALPIMEKTLQKTTVNDVVVLYISGHGVLDHALDFWYATYDMDFNEPSKNGISYQRLEGLLKNIPARKRLLLMDACHSGEVDKESEEGFVELTSSDISVNYKGTFVEDQQPKIGLQNSFELMKELFADVSRSSGVQVISAAAGNSYALESDQWENGIFTYGILYGLTPIDLEDNLYFTEKESKKNWAPADRNRDGFVSVAELQEFVRKLVDEKTHGAQKPTSRQGSIEFDFVLW